MHYKNLTKNPKIQLRRLIYLLVDLDADGAFGDIPDTSGTSMVELVRHTLVDSAVNLDVNIVSNLVGSEVGCQWNVTLLSEGTSKEISCARPETVTSRHFVFVFVREGAGGGRVQGRN